MVASTFDREILFSSLWSLCWFQATHDPNDFPFSLFLLSSFPYEMTTDSLLVELTKVKRKKTEKFFTSLTKFSHRKRLANVLKSPRVRLRMSPHRANPFLFHSISAVRFRRKIFQSKTLHLRRNSFPLASVVESNAIGGEVSR